MLRDLNQSYSGGKRRMGRCDCGIAGDQVPSSGGSSAAWMYPSLTLPADAAKQYAYWIVSHNFPFGLPLDDYSAGTIVGLPDGTYTALVTLEENGAAVPPGPFTVTVIVGAGSDLTPPTLAGSIVISSLTETGFVATCPVATDDRAVVGYQHRLDGGSWIDIAGGSRSATYSGLVPASTHALEMRAADAVPNYSAALSTSVTLLASNSLPAPGSAALEDTLRAPQDQILVVGGFAPKDPRAVKVIAFDFTRYATSISFPVVSIVRERGPADADPDAVLSGLPAVGGTLVYQRVQAGVAWTDYTVFCEVDDGLGAHLVMAGRLPVRPAH